MSKNILVVLLLLLSYLVYGQRIVEQTSDFSLNFGVNSLNHESISQSIWNPNMPINFNLNITSNQPYGRHIFEVGYSTTNEENNDILSATINNKFQNPYINYAYMHQVFAYYPSCQIANQVFAGLRLNAEAYMSEYSIMGPTINNSSTYIEHDFFEYSAALSIGTDYNFNDKNYATIQLYMPFLNKVGFPVYPGDSALNNITPFEDRSYESDYFTGGDFSFFGDFNKLGAIATYRMMFTETFGLLLKYHFQNLNYDNGNNGFHDTYQYRAHQISLGILLHS